MIDADDDVLAKKRTGGNTRDVFHTDETCPRIQGVETKTTTPGDMMGDPDHCDWCAGNVDLSACDRSYQNALLAAAEDYEGRGGSA